MLSASAYTCAWPKCDAANDGSATRKCANPKGCELRMHHYHFAEHCDANNLKDPESNKAYCPWCAVEVFGASKSFDALATNTPPPQPLGLATEISLDTPVRGAGAVAQAMREAADTHPYGDSTPVPALHDRVEIDGRHGVVIALRDTPDSQWIYVAWDRDASGALSWDPVDIKSFVAESLIPVNEVHTQRTMGVSRNIISGCIEAYFFGPACFTKKYDLYVGGVSAAPIDEHHEEKLTANISVTANFMEQVRYSFEKSVYVLPSSESDRKSVV